MGLCHNLAVGQQTDTVELGLRPVAQDFDRTGKWQIGDLAKNVELESRDCESFVEFGVFGA
jgi:hypothetical protein